MTAADFSMISLSLPSPLASLSAHYSAGPRAICEFLDDLISHIYRGCTLILFKTRCATYAHRLRSRSTFTHTYAGTPFRSIIYTYTSLYTSHPLCSYHAFLELPKLMLLFTLLTYRWMVGHFRPIPCLNSVTTSTLVSAVHPERK